MKIIENTHEAFAHVDHWRKSGQRIGLVPTMGALHEGHVSLVKRSRSECDATVVTIFVNPTQFGPNEDFSRYPRTFEADCQLLRDVGADLVFAPTPEQLYPNSFSTYVQPPSVAEGLEGDFRSTHFRGVATIVLKLFNILPATVAYFGQKDYQQLQVIKHMADDLNVPIRIVGCPTLREPDGLAMSSRNRYLSPDERESALCLWKALTLAQQLVQAGERSAPILETRMHEALLSHGADQIDYARVVDAHTLASLEEISAPAIALIAVRVGKTRLIDNLLVVDE